MPKCPNCGEEINYLLNRATADFIVEIDEDEKPKYDLIGIWDDGTYRCPECNEIIFETYTDAVEFLKEKPEKPIIEG